MNAPKETELEQRIRALVTVRGVAEGPWAPLIGKRWIENMGSAVVLAPRSVGAALKRHLGSSLVVHHYRHRPRWRLAVFTDRLLAYLESQP